MGSLRQLMPDFIGSAVDCLTKPRHPIGACRLLLFGESPRFIGQGGHSFSRYPLAYALASILPLASCRFRLIARVFHDILGFSG
ncbi:MAG TPA: hypothetical protein VIB38_07010 [Aestuariivirgaceae bacterium]